MRKNKCYVCGTDKNLKKYQNIRIKTEGYDIPLREAYVCDKDTDIVIQTKRNKKE